MRAAVLAVGSELLSVDRLDTNSLRLAAALERFGVELVRKSVVGDDEAAIAAEIRRLLADVELVVATGGLGPTADDVTREGCAQALGRPLVEDLEIVAAIESRFSALGRVAAPNNRRQALLIEGAIRLENPRGTAPGQRIEVDGKSLFLFPGVPYELEHQVEAHLEPWLRELGVDRGRERRTLKVALVPESEIDQRLTPLYEELGREAVTLLAAAGEVKIVLTADGADIERRDRLDRLAQRTRELLGTAVYAERAEATLESVVGELLVERGLSIATAESCTGGLLAQRITAVAGATRYFPGGVVSYADAEKIRLLDVESALLEEHGAVSEPVARQMATGARRRFGTDLGVGITGIAGPEGGSADKPVGTVHLAIAGPGESMMARRFRFPGDRERIRWQASQAALEWVRRYLFAVGGESSR